MEGKKPCTLINNALYNSKGRKGLSLPKRGKENVYLCRNILNWTAHTRHSQKKHWLILFLLKSFQVVHLYTKGSFKDASVCVCRDKQREKRRGRKSQIVWDRYVDQSCKPSTNRRAKSSKRSQQLHHVKKVKTLLNILPKNKVKLQKIRTIWPCNSYFTFWMPGLSQQAKFLIDCSTAKNKGNVFLFSRIKASRFHNHLLIGWILLIYHTNVRKWEIFSSSSTLPSVQSMGVWKTKSNQVNEHQPLKLTTKSKNQTGIIH